MVMGVRGDRHSEGVSILLNGCKRTFATMTIFTDGREMPLSKGTLVNRLHRRACLGES
jgi:hypothetical protein